MVDTKEVLLQWFTVFLNKRSATHKRTKINSDAELVSKRITPTNCQKFKKCTVL